MNNIVNFNERLEVRAIREYWVTRININTRLHRESQQTEEARTYRKNRLSTAALMSPIEQEAFGRILSAKVAANDLSPVPDEDRHEVDAMIAQWSQMIVEMNLSQEQIEGFLELPELQ